MVSLCAALAAVLGLGLAPVSAADTAGDKEKLDSDIARLRIALEGTSADLAKAFVELHRTQAELPAAQKALAAADAAADLASRHNQAMATALAVAKADAARAGEALAQNALDTQAVQDQLGNLARDDYQRGEVSGLSIVLEATSPADFTNRLLMMDTVMGVRRATIRRLDTMRAQGQAGQAHLVAVRGQVATLKVQAEVALVQATAARNTAAAAKTRLDQLSAAQTRYQATVAAKKAREGENLRRMQAQSESLTRALAARRFGPQGQPQSQPQGGSGFLSPPANAPVSSEFGQRFDPVLRFVALHAGIDFAAACGAPVYAAAAGEVIMTTPASLSGGYGNRLVIDHGLERGVDLTTTYNHLSSFVVTSGRVARGQLVAYAGTTGFSTGCHLHFETRQDGTPVNPRTWL
jgi:murein DD-endopeptidase MepM/ murein hydrolase activator NlpD